MSKNSELDSVTKDLMEMCHGRAILQLEEAVVFLPWARKTLTRAVDSGALRAVRASPNGKISFLARELARWMIDCQDQHSDPSPRIEDEIADIQDQLSGP